MGKIFISYRSGDTDSVADLVWHALKQRLGEDNVFLDTQVLEAGDDFPTAIAGRIEDCDALLAMRRP